MNEPPVTAARTGGGRVIDWAVVGLDNGGTMNNATVLDGAGHFLVDRMVETPSRVGEGPIFSRAVMGSSLSP